MTGYARRQTRLQAPFPTFSIGMRATFGKRQRIPSATSHITMAREPERTIELLIKARQARLRSLPRQGMFSALSYPAPTPPAD